MVHLVAQVDFMAHHSQYRSLDSYELSLVCIKPQHLAGLQALSVSVGWPQRERDWIANLALGKGVVAIDQIGRIQGSAMYFPFGEDRFAIGMTIAHPKLENSGLEEWLISHVVEKTGGGPTFLNACNHSITFYESVGASKASYIFQYQGYLLDLPRFKVTCRPANINDLQGICNCDADAYSADRSHLLRYLAGISEVRVIDRGGKIVGFSMRRQFGRGHLIGPVMAFNDDDAISLTGALMKGLKGQFIRSDTRALFGRYTEFLIATGLRAVSNVTTMGLGSWSDFHPQLAYGLSSHSTG